MATKLWVKLIIGMQGATAVVLRTTAIVPRTTAVMLGASWVTLLVMSITRVHFKSA